MNNLTKEQLSRYIEGLLSNLDAVQITYADRADIIVMKLTELGVQLPQTDVPPLHTVNKSLS